jgi:uncharacterized membrane protein required for colicin V production
MSAGLLFDAGVAAFLVLQAFLGWRRGFLWQAAGVASVAFGVLLGLYFSPALATWMNAVVTSNPFHAKLLAFLFILGTVGFTLRMAAAWAEVHSETNLPKQEKELRRADDRMLGGIFGALKGCVLALMLVAAAVTFWPHWKIWRDSALAQPMAVAGARLLPPEAMREVSLWAERSAHDLRAGLDIH